MKLKLFILVITIQIGLIIYILYGIYKKNNNLTASVNTINKNSITKETSNEIKYFYEPKANQIGLVKEDWLKKKVKNTINNDTLNDRYEYFVNKEQDVFRIITLGDSFTYGENVSTENNWTELLEDALNNHKSCKNFKKYEVINLGMKGYDTQYEVERYKRRGKKYNPDLVIWLFTDYERLLELMMPFIKINDTTENKKLEGNGLFYNNWKIARATVLNEIGTKGVIQYQSEQIQKLDSHFNNKLIYATFPDRPQYLQLLKSKAERRTNSYYFRINIDLNNQQIILPDKHLNEEGNKFLMQEMLNFINKNEIIPCQ